MAKKRLFIGIPASPGLKENIKDWSRLKLKDPRIRIVNPNNLHITLVPPWYEKKAGSIKDKLEALRSTAPFEIEFIKIEVGPTLRKPRLVWATGKSDKNIQELKKRTGSSLEKSSNRRPFLLHLTIARFKKRDFSKISFDKLEWHFYWRETVDRVCLFESILKSSGAEYKVLHTVRLVSGGN